MATITLQDSSSQGENLPAKSTTISLQNPLAKAVSQPTRVKTLSEAKTLPEGGIQIMSEEYKQSENPISQEETWFNIHYYIPYILEGKLFVRDIFTQTNNSKGIHTIEFEDKTGMQGRVHEHYCPDGNDFDHFESIVLEGNTTLEAPIQTELNGKPALIFRRLHSNGKENLYLAYYGDKKTIAKLLQRYESGIKTRQAGAGAKEAVRKLPERPKVSILTRWLKKRD